MALFSWEKGRWERGIQNPGHLRPRLGTDGALALSIAHVLIKNGWVDYEYIEKYVHGFEEYSHYVEAFTPEKGEELTGVPGALIVEAAGMIHDSASMSICESSAPIGHHKNGMQNYRAIMSLLAITGNYDREGGQVPSVHTYMELDCGFHTEEEAFMNGRFPAGGRRAVGADRFPLWYELRKEMQSNALADAVLQDDPQRIRAVFALGMNMRMFAGDFKMKQALEKLEYFVDADLFLTDTARYADIVLPACTSMERGEFKCYPGGYAWYTNPVTEPLGQSKSDVDILTLLARKMEYGDPLLTEGYEACVRYMIQGLSVTVEQLKSSPVPIKIKDYKPYQPGTMLKKGLPTRTGKFELVSSVIAEHPEWGLDAGISYCPPENPDPQKWPMTLCAGARIPHAIHSRLHDVPWARSLQKQPSAQISFEDAQQLNVENGDKIEVETPFGALTYAAIPTKQVKPGEVFVFHGYREADINSILDPDNLDPYSGFPAYRSGYCRIRRSSR